MSEEFGLFMEVFGLFCLTCVVWYGIIIGLIYWLEWRDRQK